MTLIVENGTGLSNSNSYISVADADSYHQSHGNALTWVDTQAKGTLYLPTTPSDGDTITIDTKTYTFQTSLTNTDGHVAIGASLVEAQNNLYAAISLLGVPGTNYAAATTAHPTVTMAAFVANAAVLTAVTGGVDGNAIATTTSTTSAANRFDNGTLGRTQAGVDDKTPALQRATQYLETMYRGRWIERRTNQHQALSWPRAFIDDSDGYPIDSITVPQEVKDAQAELALRALTEDLLPDLLPTANAPIMSKSVTVGPITKSTTYGASGLTPLKKYRVIDMLLRQYVNSPGRLERA